MEEGRERMRRGENEKGRERDASQTSERGDGSMVAQSPHHESN